MPDHDYASGGAYFVTICTEGRRLLFGDVVDEAMRSNDAGRMIEAIWHESLQFCRAVSSEAFQVMPNHIHGLVVIASSPPDLNDGRPTSLPEFVKRFKSMSTRRYADGVRAGRWPAYRERLWQRGYYEHLIRNDRARERVIQYIAANPASWAFDRENPDASAPRDL